MKSRLNRSLEKKKAFYEDEINHLNQTIDKLKIQLIETEEKATKQMSRAEIGSLTNFNVS